ncbi:class I SAM-dependent methyltransferase [Amycolatopsis sp. NBC_01286]|uniref:class I SAM-dependent methyltransferase n=1 Tax=Amycolatopsis sp. NBC_01286 TaxID=2903560 RepID=UPI002E0E1BF9|nr:class I SAM-dependent methyltransferase [Amycolatopsis sp. NBC_01286]
MATTDVRFFDQRTPQERDRSFLPGMRKTWLLPFYDVFTRFAGVGALHERLADLAGIESGQAVVDVGCGTANLSLAVLASQPGARVSGLDPDGDALRRGMRKARRRGVSLTLVQGYADRIPAEDVSLDHVISSLALHHLDDDGRVAFARDAFRALRPGGRVTIADFGGAPTHGHGHGRALRHLPRVLRHRGAQNPAVARGNGVVTLLETAGFGDAGEIAHADHRLGRITFVQATRPSS